MARITLSHMPYYKLPLLARDVQGNLMFKFTQAQLQFPDGRQGGDISTPGSAASSSSIPHRNTAWMYTLHPSGMTDMGSVGIDFACQQLNGSLDYVPMDHACVLLFGLQPTSKTISPNGVGLVENRRSMSVGIQQYETLDDLLRPGR